MSKGYEKAIEEHREYERLCDKFQEDIVTYDKYDNDFDYLIDYKSHFKELKNR